MFFCMLILLCSRSYASSLNKERTNSKQFFIGQSDETNICNMPDFDGGSINKTVDGEITFYDMGGEEKGISSLITSLVVFTPKNPGKTIEIEFQEVDLNAGALLKLYKGKIALEEDEDWSGDTEYSLPWSGEFAKITTNTKILKYKSTKLSGELSVGFTNSNGSGKGWKAIVREVDAEPFDGILIGTEHKTIEISTDKHFYDDGGPEDNSSEGFEGQITFVPKDPNKKIKLDFQSFEIFNTYKPNNTIFKVYNGKEVNEDNLIGEYLNNPSEIKSSSVDGALTVYAKVKVSNTKTGWDVIVKQFAPSPMLVDECIGSQSKAKEVMAGSTGVEVYALNIKTSNSLNALNLQSVKFSTEGSTNAASDISTAQLFASKSFDDFTKAKAVSNKLDNPNGEFNLNLNQGLLEGNNYFWLVYDIKESARDGDSLDAKCLSVNCSSKDYSISNSAPNIKHSIKNVFKMKVGHSNVKVFGQYGFTDDDAQYGGKYGYGVRGDQIVTFKASDDKNMLQLDFSEFDIYYTKRQKTKFIVYSGTELIEKNILWELNSEDQAEVGPGMHLRSNEKHKELTIVFNTNGASSYRTKKGWIAKVKEYLPSDMKLQNLKIEQASSESVKGGSVNVPLLKISMNLDGVLNPISFNSIFINPKGRSENVVKYKLFTTGKNNEFSATNLLGESNLKKSQIEIKGNLEFPEGKQYFWIAADLAVSAKIGDRVDASFVKLLAGGKEYTADLADPDGDRLIVNELKLQNGDNGECIVGETLVFYDDGGKDEKYSKDFDGKVTFVPANKAMAVKLLFREFTVSSRQYVKIYSGKEINEENLLDELSGYKVPEKEYISSAEDGSLTFSFKSAHYGNNKGWKAELSQYKPEMLSVSNVTATHPSCDTKVRGSKNVQLLKVKLDAIGDKGSVNLENLKFKISNENKLALKNFRLYYTASKDGFNDGLLFGEEIETVDNSFSFTDIEKLPKKDSYYLWLVADIKKSVALDIKIDAELISCNVDKKEIKATDGNPDGDIAIKAGHKGEYIIGASDEANYNTFADAIKFLEEGIEGDITFLIESGTYDEVVRVPHINGASDEARITFKSKTNNSDDVIISSEKYSPPMYPDPNYGMFNIEGADYITLKNITFKTNNINYEAVILLSNMSRHVSIKSNKVISETVDSGSFSGGSISLIETFAGSSEGENNDYICIDNNILTGGYIGANVSGTGIVKYSKEKGAIIKNNTFSKQGSKAIYLNNEENAFVFDNLITNSVTKKSGFQGMDLYRVIGESSVYNNRIILDGLESCAGIELRGCVTEKVDGFPIYNNMIAINNGKSTCTAFLVNRDTKNVSILYNTACIKGVTQSSSRTFSMERGESSNVRVVNNIFQNKAGGHIYAVLNERFCKDYIFSSNVYFSTGNIMKYGTNNNFPLHEWRSKMKDESSSVKEAEFYNDKDLHLLKSEGFRSDTPISFIKTDIDGNIRDKNHPFIGADEFTEPDDIAPEMCKDFPKLKDISSNSLTALVKINESGRVYFLALDKNTKHPSIEQVKTGKFIDVYKDVESDVLLKKLKDHHEYTVYFAIEDVFKNTLDKVFKLEVKTKYKPTAVSTFEEIETGNFDFDDATAHFKGFSVVKEKGPRYSYRIAKLDANKTGIVTILNTDDGLKLNGFFLKSESTVIVKGIALNKTVSKEITINACEKWKFICIHELGEVTQVEFSSGDKPFYIDNFSGKPLALKYLGDDYYRIDKDEDYNFIPKIEGGAEPFNITWTNMKNGELIEGNSLVLNLKNSNSYRFTLTDALGGSLSHKVAFNKTIELGIGSFEDLSLEDESYYWGDKAANSEIDYFYTGSYQLENCLADKYATWGGFAYSNITSDEFDPGNFLTHQFRSAAGGAACGTKNFGVVYTLGTSTRMQLTNSEEDQSLTGMYITNSAWLVNSVKNGDPIIGEKFKEGDWYKIVAIGINKYGEEVSKSEFYLADYRDASNLVLIEDWQWWDLSSLGKISAIKFKSEGSRMNNRGLTLPAYFCIDEINNKKKDAPVPLPIVFNKIEDIEMDAISYESISFTEIFPEDIPMEEQSIELISNSNNKILSISIENNSILLESTKNLGGKTDISLKAKCPKHEEILNFSVNIIAEKEIEVIVPEFKIFPNPVSRGENLIIRCEWDKWNAQIFDLSGHLIIDFKSENNEKEMDISNISTGMYILKVFTDSEQKTKRIIIQ